MNRKQLKNTIAVLSGVGVGISVASYFLTRKLTKLALDRDATKTVEHIKTIFAGSDKLKEVSNQVTQAAAVLEDTPHEVVTIRSYDDLELVGHFFPVPSAKRTILAFHGWRSGWSQDFGIIDSFWRSNDCQVLYVEQRGQNASEGDYMGFGLLERNDVLSWAHYIAETQPDLPIYLCGVSMGATSILMASDLDLTEQVHGMLADCGFTSPYAIWKHVTENNLHLPYNGVRSKIVDDICKERLNMKSNQFSTTMALHHAKVPVLFAHGTDDHFVPVNMTYENYMACTAEKELLIVPGADHGMSCLIEPDRYFKTCLSFFSRYDQKKPACSGL